MHRLTHLSLLVALVLMGQMSLAQTDSTEKKNDSLNAIILQDYSKKLAEVDQQRVADSIKRVELEAQLNSLKTTDNLKKGALQQQLQELTNRDAVRLSQKRARIDSLRKTARAFPVTGFFADTLFQIYSKLGSFPAHDRADAISLRIQKLADNFTFSPDSLKIAPAETTVDLVFGHTIIMSVSENDALWSNTTPDSLAHFYQQIIGQAVVRYKAETSVITLAKEVALALLTLAIVGVLLFYIGRFFGWSEAKIREQEGGIIGGVKLKDYVLFDAKRQTEAIVSVNTIIKWLIMLLVVYLALPLLFGFFPWTRGFADTLFGYVLNPLRNMGRSLLDYLPNLITILVIVFVFRYVLKGIYFLKTEIEAGNLTITGFYPDWANPTYQIIRVLIFAFMLIVIFPYLPGSDSPVFQGVSVFLGFLFTFGSAGSLSNIIAGLILTYMRLFRIGDRVKIGDVSGDVIEKSLLVTRVRTIKNEIISIPNSAVMNNHTTNYSSDALERGLIIHSTVTIGYDVPWKDMHQILIDAALRTDCVLSDPAPFVLQTSLDDFYVSYQINAYVHEVKKQALIYSGLHQHIQDVCNERGVEIMSPHYRAARDGSMTTIPASYLPKDYEVPGFNVDVKNGKE